MTSRAPLAYAYQRLLADGRLITVEVCAVHGVGVGIGAPELLDDLWLYPDLPTAVAAAQAWDGTGEPLGWCRHPVSGRTHAA